MIICTIFAILLFCASTVFVKKLADHKQDYLDQIDIIHQNHDFNVDPFPPRITEWCDGVECHHIITASVSIMGCINFFPLIYNSFTVLM